MKRTLISLISLAIFFVPISANAHAGVVATSPSQNEVLTSMPSEISVTFSEELMTLKNQEINTISLSLFDGPPIDLADIKISGTILSASIPEGEYDSGVYEVFYRIVSADGHKVSNSFTFSLNAPALVAEPVVAKGDGVLPAPIAAAIAIVVLLGGYLAFRANKRKS